MTLRTHCGRRYPRAFMAPYGCRPTLRVPTLNFRPAIDLVSGSALKQSAVLDSRPSHLRNRSNTMGGQFCSEPLRDSFVKQHAHGRVRWRLP